MKTQLVHNGPMRDFPFDMQALSDAERAFVVYGGGDASKLPRVLTWYKHSESVRLAHSFRAHANIHNSVFERFAERVASLIQRRLLDPNNLARPWSA
jgi:hypothetical protein